MTIKDSSNKPVEQILIEAGIVPTSQMELALQEKQHNNLQVDEILVLHGWIEQGIVDFFMNRWSELIQEKNKKPLAYYLQEAKLLNSEQVNIIFDLQKQAPKKIRFHRLAVQQGFIKQITIDFFLSNLFNIYNPKAIAVTRPFEILKRYTEGDRNFQKINLSESPLVSVSLKDINLDGSILSKADLSKSNLSQSSLIRVNSRQVNYSKAVLTGVNFSRSCLTKSNFQSAHLEQVNFQSAILQEVDFTNAYLASANFAGADLTNAKLPADFPYTVYYDDHTSFDFEFDPIKMGWQKITVD